MTRDKKPDSVFAPHMDPCDIYLPMDVTGELMRCAASNGRISYEYLLAIYRKGKADAALRSRPAPPDDLVAPAVGSPFPLEHSPTCGDHYDPDARCTCGLSWRIRLVTEQEHRAAWQKRAEEAEAREIAAPAPVADAEPRGMNSQDTWKEGRYGHTPVAAPAPETRVSYSCPHCGREYDRPVPAPETPAPDAMPCPECLGMPCAACNGTGRRQEAQP